MSSVDDLNTLYPAFADITVMLSVSEQRISQKEVTAIGDVRIRQRSPQPCNRA